MCRECSAAPPGLDTPQRDIRGLAPPATFRPSLRDFSGDHLDFSRSCLDWNERHLRQNPLGGLRQDLLGEAMDAVLSESAVWVKLLGLEIPGETRADLVLLLEVLGRAQRA